MSIFTESELAYLAEQKLGRLATKAPGGTLQSFSREIIRIHPERILSWGLPESSTRKVT